MRGSEEGRWKSTHLGNSLAAYPTARTVPRGGKCRETPTYPDYTPGRQMTLRHAYWAPGEDARQHRASFFDAESKGYFTEYELGFPDSTYSTSNLSALGK